MNNNVVLELLKIVCGHLSATWSRYRHCESGPGREHLNFANLSLVTTAF